MNKKYLTDSMGVPNFSNSSTIEDTSYLEFASQAINSGAATYSEQYYPATLVAFSVIDLTTSSEAQQNTSEQDIDLSKKADSAGENSVPKSGSGAETTKLKFDLSKLKKIAIGLALTAGLAASFYLILDFNNNQNRLVSSNITEIKICENSTSCSPDIYIDRHDKNEQINFNKIH